MSAANGERLTGGTRVSGATGGTVSPRLSGASVPSGSAVKTILVADDESHILNVVSLKLRNAGFRVLTANDGQEALEIAQKELPDLIITDYHMPLLSGLELCRRLKQDGRTYRIPAIMLTARGYHLEPRDTEDSGIRVMLSKPFSPRQLLATVNEMLEAGQIAPASGAAA